MLIMYLIYVNIKTIVNDYAKHVVLLMVMEHAVNKNNNNNNNNNNTHVIQQEKTHFGDLQTLHNLMVLITI
jgi:hypothetical protein